MSAASPLASTASSSLELMLASARARTVSHLDYAGDVEVEEAYAFLCHNAAVLVDVRTLPEWQFVGLPDLQGTGSQLATISWKHYPDFSTNPRFAEQLGAIPGVSPDTPLLFLCRSGGRSLDAAVAMTARGYRYCFNVGGGFEGDPDAAGRRGSAGGWKAKSLPWKQS